jgi:hypothetical protein
MVLDNAAGHYQCGAVGIACAHDNPVGLHKLQGLASCMQLTIYNVGDPAGTIIHNGGLENTMEVLDMVLDNAAGHQCGRQSALHALTTSAPDSTNCCCRTCYMQLTIYNLGTQHDAKWEPRKHDLSSGYGSRQ